MERDNPYAALAAELDRTLGPRRLRSLRMPTAIKRAGSQFVKACRAQTPAVLEKVLFFGGMAAVVWGVWMVYRPLGPIVGGGLAVWLGMLISVERDEPGA